MISFQKIPVFFHSERAYVDPDLKRYLHIPAAHGEYNLVHFPQIYNRFYVPDLPRNPVQWCGFVFPQWYPQFPVSDE